MALTRTQIKDYIRSKLTELDNKVVTDGMLNIDVNLALRKVQRDIMSLGIKQFTKTAYITGAYSAVPTDMLAVPNSIIDMRCGVGVRATIAGTFGTATGGNVTATILMRETGTAGNGWGITFTTGASATVTTDVGAKTVTVTVVSTTTTVSALQAILTADSMLNNYMTITLSGATGAMTVSTSTLLTTASGTGAGHYPARELSIEDYNRVNSNTYLIPSITEPAFVRKGDSAGSQYISILPDTIDFATMEYRYKLADFSTDASTNPLPEEYEELLLMDMLTKTYTTLKQQALSQDKTVEYETKIKELEGKYMQQLNYSALEDKRLKETK